MSDSGKVDPPLTATTTTTTPDPDPYLQNLMAAKVMDQSSQLFVNWTAAQGVGNCVVTYRITWSPVSEGDGSGTSYTTSLSHTITQLEAWTTYHVCVASRTDEEYTPDKCTNGRTDEDKPEPPVIMSVEPAPSSSLRVKWSTPEKPNGVITIYTITWTWEGHMDHTITPDNTYTTTDLLPCTTYSVTVRAATSKGYGPESDPLTGTTYRVDPDPYLQDLMAAKVMDQSSQLFVNWTAAQGVGNCVVTYRITWRPVSESDGSGTVNTSLSYTITQLEAWTTYHVCVAARTKTDYSQDKCTNTTTDEDKPGPLQKPVVEPSSFSSLRVSWSTPEKSNGVITNYNITWTWEGSMDHTITPDNTTNYTITDLLPCTTCSVTVRAATSKGYGPESEAVTGTTDRKDPDPYLQDVMAAKVMDQSSQLFVNWTAVQGVGNCVVTYRITWRPVSEGDGSGTNTTTSLSYTITQLEAWTTYHVCVAATTKTKYNHDKCTNTTTDEDTPGPPAITRIQSTTSDSLLVVWEPPEKPRGIITNYNVTWNTSVVAGVTGNITQYNITSLEACTLYNIIVKAATIKGYGDRGDARGSTDGNPPEATQKVSCVLPTSPHDLTVTWSSITSSCPVLRYTVNYTGHGLWSHDNTHGSRDTDTIYVDLRNITPWTAYNVCVAGVIVNNIVGAWNCCQATTLESASGPPASLNLTDKSSSSVKVCWDEPVQLNGELTLYQLIWGANNKSLSHNLTSYTISGLQSNSLYNVTLQAGTAAGVGPPVWDAVTTDKGVNVGGIVAGVVVGVLLLALIVAAVVFRDKLKDKMKKRTTPTSPPPELPMTSRPPSVVVSTEVKKNELHEYIEYLEGDTHRALDAELAQIDEQSPSFPHFHARKDFNKPKNRFQNIYPFDHARVKLSPIPGVEGSEYINASYVLDIHERPYFIATQGPKLNTVKDFWRMVMEQRVYTIIMLSNVREKGREKCAQYWPISNETCINIGSYIIRNHREERQELYSIRYLEVAAGEQKRMVKQYHFTAWPDFGAPKHVTDLLDFMADIRSTMPTNGDHLLVHCSAGVGRTGTFIGLWNLIDEADADTTTEYVNIKQTVMKMRERRPIMVQSTEQFLYLTKCISAYLEAPHLWAKQQEDDNHIYDNGAFEDNDDPIYVNT